MSSLYLMLERSKIGFSFPKYQPMHRLLAIAITCAAFGASANPSCEKLYAKHLSTDLRLSYEAFDQTEGKGFRVLAKQGCNKQAAELIERYIASTGAKEKSLLWHIAQMRAMHGSYANAINTRAKSSQTPKTLKKIR